MSNDSIAAMKSKSTKAKYAGAGVATLAIGGLIVKLTPDDARNWLTIIMEFYVPIIVIGSMCVIIYLYRAQVEQHQAERQEQQDQHRSCVSELSRMRAIIYEILRLNIRASDLPIDRTSFENGDFSDYDKDHLVNIIRKRAPDQERAKPVVNRRRARASK